MVPSSADLTYFLEVAVTGNISRAAERLGITQPALSLALKRLESNFGTDLLIRTKTGVQLTKPGARVASRARDLIDEWQKLRNDALRDENEISGRYVIGCHPSVALYSLPQFLPDLLVRHPKLEIELKHGLSRQVTEHVVSFQADFGIVVNPVQHPELIIKKLTTDEVGLWAGPKKTPLQDLESGSGVLICDPDLLQTQALLKQLDKRKVRFDRVLYSSSLEVITGLVASGSGVGIIPGRVATKNRELGLKKLSTTPIFNDTICLIFRSKKSQGAKVISEMISKAFK